MAAVVEHLILEMGGFLGSKYKTRYHDNLGDNLQHALEVIEQEGWEVVTSFVNTSGYITVILKRVPR